MKKSCSYVVLLAALFFLGAVHDSFGQYIFTTLDDPLGTNGTFAFGISRNNVTGFYIGGSGAQGFLYNGSTYTTLNDPLGFSTAALGISGNTIVGSYSTHDASADHGFIYDIPTQTYTTLDPPGGTQTQAVGVSSTGTIVGNYFKNLGSFSAGYGFSYSNGSFTTLSVPGATGTGTAAYGIFGNNIVGYYEGTGRVNYGFLYDGSNYLTLDDPLATHIPANANVQPSISGTTGCGISGNTIVGYYNDSNYILHGFLYNISTATYTTVDNPLGTKGTAIYGIDGDTLVGFYIDSNSTYHGFKATPDLYYQWLQQNGYTPGGANTGFGQDANHNGIPNGVEYMIPTGLNVVRGTSSSTITALVRQDPQATTTLWSSTDMSTWTQTSFPSAADQSGVPAGFVRMQVVDTPLVSKKFFRVKVTR
jgi:hypothetical protein